MARRKQGILDDLFEITAMLPWWLGVVLAIVAYLALHPFADMEFVATTNPKDIGGMIFKPMFRAFATVGQYLLPFVFLIGSLVSAFSHANRKPRISRARQRLDPLNVQEQSPQPRPPENDLYELYKSAGVAPRPRPDVWSLELLRAIDWKRFEEVCAEYFRVCGFHASTQSHGPDGGIDIKLYAPNDKTQIVNIVQCKQWSRPVGPKLMRELLGVMTANKVPRGTFVTSSTFNNDATQFAAENRIHLIDGKHFLKQIIERPQWDQERLLKVATEGDYLTPTCPNCGIKMVARENNKDKSKFWGCLNFPRCRFTLPY
jgi:restriction system protein